MDLSPHSQTARGSACPERRMDCSRSPRRQFNMPTARSFAREAHKLAKQNLVLADQAGDCARTELIDAESMERRQNQAVLSTELDAFLSSHLARQAEVREWRAYCKDGENSEKLSQAKCNVETAKDKAQDAEHGKANATSRRQLCQSILNSAKEDKDEALENFEDKLAIWSEANVAAKSAETKRQTGENAQSTVEWKLWAQQLRCAKPPDGADVEADEEALKDLELVKTAATTAHEESELRERACNRVRDHAMTECEAAEGGLREKEAVVDQGHKLVSGADLQLRKAAGKCLEASHSLIETHQDFNWASQEKRSSQLELATTQKVAAICVGRADSFKQFAERAQAGVPEASQRLSKACQKCMSRENSSLVADCEVAQTHNYLMSFNEAPAWSFSSSQRLGC